jgi:tripartite-type tricarboxylate transporter receptor subunit TctC
MAVTKREDAVHLARSLLAAVFAAGVWLATLSSPAQAQDFPNRTIRFVVAFPAGGPTDFVARLLADKVKTLLGQSVIVENKPGANGAIGADYVAKSDPDGHTIFFTTVGAVAITPNMRADLPYDTLRDFAPVMRVVRNTTILVVNANLPIKSARELAELAKTKPGDIPFASTGVGSMPHLALELFQSAGQVKFLHVPYRGAAPAVTDLLGGQVQALFADAPVVLGQIQAGKLRALAAASDQRTEVLPDVLTLAEQGFPGTHAENWYGLLVPAKTPPAVIAKINDAVTKSLGDPDIRQKLLASGAVPAPTSPEEFGKLLRDEIERWGKVVRDKGIKEGA